MSINIVRAAQVAWGGGIPPGVRAISLKRLALDLFADGYKAVGLAAPVLSILFTVAKARDWTGYLENIDYAWALLPIVIWLCIAYWRRHKQSVEFEEALRDKRNRAAIIQAIGESMAAVNRAISEIEKTPTLIADQFFKDVLDAEFARLQPIILPGEYLALSSRCQPGAYHRVGMNDEQNLAITLLDILMERLRVLLSRYS